MSYQRERDEFIAVDLSLTCVECGITGEAIICGNCLMCDACEQLYALDCEERITRQ